MALSVSGLGSNLPIDDLITKLMTVEAQPLQQLAVKEATYLGKVSALGQVKSSIASFQTATRALQDGSRFESINSSSSNTDVAAIAVSSKAAVANYALHVDELAQSQKLASAAVSSSKSAIGSGTLRFYFGTDNGASGFALNGDKPYKDVTIKSGATLEDIRDAVNAAKIGVSASIVNDGSGYKLVYSSADTGSKNALKVVTNDASLTSLTNADKLFTDAAFSATSATSATLTAVQAAKDAKFTLDGISITKSSNVVTDAVDGLTITLKKKQETTDVAISLVVSKDSSGIKKTIESFVKAFNDLNTTLTNLSSFDSAEPKPGEQRKAAALNGESVIRSVKTQIRSVFNSVQNVSGAFKLPADVGISFNTDGTMKLDSSKLQKAIDSNPQDIVKLFGSVGTPTDSQVSFVSATGKTTSGTYALAVSSLQNGVLAGATAVPSNLIVAVPGPATGQSFQVKINGTTSGSLTLANGAYTPAALATALQTAINADSALTTAGAKVSVTVDSASGKLVLTSQKTGSDSTVEVLSGLDAVGSPAVNLFSNGAGVAGSANIAGTIGGYAASGSGNTLTGAVGTPVEGLALSVSGGVTGDRGEVVFAKGFAFALDGVLTQLLDSKTGPIAARTEGLNASVKGIANQRDVINRRLQDTEARYRKQFTALDSLVSQWTNLGTYLTQQLASLNKSG